MTTRSPVIVALDFSAADAALALANQLHPAWCRLKVGKELFTAAGPALIRALQAKGFEIFLDLKFHDIPNTVAAAVRAAADLNVWMVNVHASGGERMMVAAKQALEPFGASAPLLTAVTVLTSMTAEDLAAVGVADSAAHQVRRLAQLARQCDLDGVVCSAQEAVQLRAELGSDFLLVTPGIRPVGSATDDQRRTATPQGAVAAGSNFLVIGRPIAQSANPTAALAAIHQELGLDFSA